MVSEQSQDPAPEPRPHDFEYYKFAVDRSLGVLEGEHRRREQLERKASAAAAVSLAFAAYAVDHLSRDASCWTHVAFALAAVANVTGLFLAARAVWVRPTDGVDLKQWYEDMESFAPIDRLEASLKHVQGVREGVRDELGRRAFAARGSQVAALAAVFLYLVFLGVNALTP